MDCRGGLPFGNADLDVRELRGSHERWELCPSSNRQRLHSHGKNCTPPGRAGPAEAQDGTLAQEVYTGPTPQRRILPQSHHVVAGDRHGSFQRPWAVRVSHPTRSGGRRNRPNPLAFSVSEGNSTRQAPSHAPIPWFSPGRHRSRLPRRRGRGADGRISAVSWPCPKSMRRPPKVRRGVAMLHLRGLGEWQLSEAA